jgi:hypothetical protein
MKFRILSPYFLAIKKPAIPIIIHTKAVIVAVNSQVLAVTSAAETTSPENAANELAIDK